MRFNGADYVPQRDDARLSSQYRRIWSLMVDSSPRTLDEISRLTGDGPASISAQLRHMRKRRFGGHQIVREHLGGGLYTYQLIPSNGVKLMSKDWTIGDKTWAWHEFLNGASVQLITELIGGRPEDFNYWVRDVCAGRQKCPYAGRRSGWWTARLDRLLLRMHTEGLHFLTASRLLGFSPAEVQARLELYGQRRIL